MKNLTYKTFSQKILLAAVTCTMFVIPTVQAEDFSANLVGIIGNKFLDNDWQEFDSQSALGVSYDFKYQGWPFSLTIATIFSVHDGLNNASFFGEDFLDSAFFGSSEGIGFTSETHLGIRKILTINGTPVEPYIGGGLVLVTARLDQRIDTDVDFTVGFWVGGGLYWHITERFIVGLDVRYSDAEVTLFGTDIEAGGLYTNITIGRHWY